MITEEIKALLVEKLGLTEVHITGDGSHFQVVVVGNIFDGLSRVKQQQVVYTPLMDYIADNRIHALSIKAFTPQQWQRERALNGY